MSLRARATFRPVIALTLGDPSGIGPEIVNAALADKSLWRYAVPLVFGDARLIENARGRRPLMRWQGGRPAAPAIASIEEGASARPGEPDKAGAGAQLRAIEMACDAVARGEADAMSTAPVSKAQIASTGLDFTGHTEFLAARFNARVLMMMAGPRLRVAVATTHLPLAEVSKRLTTVSLVADLKLLDAALHAQFGIRKPRIAVTGLNPHAGEGGHFGREEMEIIEPAVVAARAAGVRADGPFSADGLFPRALRGDYDAVLAMYHDQGLIPVKLAHFESAVNVTLGLPFPRTSPDHGVAYDLAGKHRADPRSTIAAVRMAIAMALVRGPRDLGKVAGR